MTEIKFRAWNMYAVFKHNKIPRLIYFELTDLDEGYHDLSGTYLGTDTIIMPCIGLKDKNRIEIYAGDIVRNKYKPYTSYTSGSEVFFDYDGAWIRIGDSKLKLTELGELEIIGNIYENSNLSDKYGGQQQ